MLFKRKIYQKLLDWKNESNGTTGMLIEGPKCVGKTTIVKEFAKNEYKKSLIIDFSKGDDQVKGYFDNYIDDLDTLFMLLQAKYNVKLIPRKSLIVFDEVQYCVKARQAIKYLVKDGRYDYIETGSLIGIKENVKDILIPSEEDSIMMFPLDFEEFLWALNEDLMCEYIKTCFDKLKPLEKGLHEKAMFLFQEYMLVGGMPESVKAFIENNQSFFKSNDVKTKILECFDNDIEDIKFNYKNKVKAIFDKIPDFLSNKEKRVMLKQLDNTKKRYDLFNQTFWWLEESRTCYKSYLIRDPDYKYGLFDDTSFIKCYICDNGLLVTKVINKENKNDFKIYDEIINGNLSINNGMFFENIIAQTLVTNGYKLNFYNHYDEKKHRNDIEIDIIINNGSKINTKIYPIEVKPGIRYQTKSLEKFIKKYKKKVDKAYVIHSKNLMIKENGIICIPAYMTFCL